VFITTQRRPREALLFESRIVCQEECRKEKPVRLWAHSLAHACQQALVLVSVYDHDHNELSDSKKREPFGGRER
jgi:hypothetical protein